MGKRIYIRTDKNGTKIYHDYTCKRCGGLGGADKWDFTGWTCYECGGKGITSKPEVYKEYTEEYKEKLEERAEKRRIKWEQEHAELIAKQKAELEERIRKEQEEQEMIYNYVAWFEVPAFRGYGTDTIYIYNFSDNKGNTFSWKTQKCVAKKVGDDWIEPDEGSKVVVKGTIKEHNEYKGEKQTVLTRCKVTF